MILHKDNIIHIIIKILIIKLVSLQNVGQFNSKKHYTYIRYIDSILIQMIISILIITNNNQSCLLSIYE